MASYNPYSTDNSSTTYASYPPTYGNGNGNGGPDTNYNKGMADPRNAIMRTPSPTPSEQAELSHNQALNWRMLANWRFWIRKEWKWYYLIVIVIAVISILITVYHDQIVTALTPATNWMKSITVGWLIPIGVLFVISFPPLFGHEIVAILCGLVWGLWIGFAIVAAGSVLGELGNFYAFRYCCSARGEKMEKSSFFYAYLAKIVREGGFKIALIARYSAIPGHFTTAIFATCGMNVFVFLIAAILSSPKQFITVYLGVLLQESGTETKSTKNRLITDGVVVVTGIVTALAMWYMFREMSKVKPEVIYARRKERQAKMARGETAPYSNSGVAMSGSSVGFNPSQTDIPMSNRPASYQQWDKQGRAMGYAQDPRFQDPNLLAPQPQAPYAVSRPHQERTPTFRTEGGGGFDLYGQRYTEDEGQGVVYPSSSEDAHTLVRNRTPSSSGHGSPTDGTLQDPFASNETLQQQPTASYPQMQTPTTSRPQQQQTATTPRLPPPPSGGLPLTTPPPPASHLALVNAAFGPEETPTQEQYATFPQGQHARYPNVSVTSPDLPSPSWPAEYGREEGGHQQTPTAGSYHTHVAEATDASYRTAYESHSRGPTQGQDGPAGPGRTFSPPPPSYKTTTS